MSKTEKTYHLETIVDLRPGMKIAIDDAVPQDADGNYLINVGYLRVSTDRQADVGFGLDIQEADIVRYCKANAYPNLLLFTDDGYTGTNMERPALRAIIDMIEAYNASRSHLRVNALIVARIDRLGRTLLGTLQFIQDYIVSARDSKNSAVNRNREDINFVSVAENYCRIDKDNPQGKFLLMLFATLAEFDRDQIVEKLKRGRMARVASGKWMGGGNTPYGYRYDRERGALLVVSEEAETIREVFRLYIEEKMAPEKIAERFGFGSDRTVTQILKRKSLTGCIVYNGEEYPGTHEAIIPLERWEEAQEELARRSVHRTATHYMLSGLVWCGECGAKMRYQKWGQQGVKLVCYSQQKSKKKLIRDENCDNDRFPSREVEAAVEAELMRLSYLGNEGIRKTLGAADPMTALERELVAAKRHLSRLYDFEDEEETDDVLREKILNVKRRIAHIEAQMRQEREKQSLDRKAKKISEILRTLRSTWPHMSAAEKQTVCQEMFDRVVLYKDGRVDIHLKLRSYYVEEAAT